MKFGEYLIENKFVSEQQLVNALRIQRYQKRKIGRLLCELNVLDPLTLNRCLIDFLNPPNISSITEVERLLSSKNMPAHASAVVQESNVLLTPMEDETFLLASEIFDDLLHEKIEKKLGKPVVFKFVGGDILSHFRKNFNFISNRHTNISIHKNESDDQKIADDSPYTRLFRETLGEAIAIDASDIHIEPGSHGATVLFRVHGDREIYKSLPFEHRDAFIAKVKQVVNLPLATLGRPADSRSSFADLKVDLRANATRILDGDKIVLRLLKQDRSFDLNQSGLDTVTVSALRSAIDAQNGLILIAGPTGSGKSTTLYSLLNSIDRKRYNVSTIENPVEYRIDGINQIDISDSGAMTFNDAIRALMRQDPDVILVGEIRDEQTAELCFKAASTGHVVLSTIHANGAAEVVERLKLLGIDWLSLTSNLRFAGAQRLLKRICPQCSLSASQVEFSGKSDIDLDLLKFQNRNGCSVCRKGLIGRTPVLEFLSLSGKSNKRNLSLDSHSIEIQTRKLAFAGHICASEIEFQNLGGDSQISTF